MKNNINKNIKNRKFLKNGNLFIPNNLNNKKLLYQGNVQIFLPNRRKAFQSSGGGGFTYYSSDNNNSGYLRRTAALTGLSDGQRALGSFWFKYTALAGEVDSFLLAVGDFTEYTFTVIISTGYIYVNGENTSGTTILRVYITAPSENTWHHLAYSIDMSTAGRYQIYVDGVDASPGSITFTAGSTIDFGGQSDCTLFGNLFGPLYDGLICEYYFTTPAAYYDLSISANLLKFITAGGKPENLGSDGSTPTGTQPLIYLKNSYSTIGTNFGSGGDFTSYGTFLDGGADKP